MAKPPATAGGTDLFLRYSHPTQFKNLSLTFYVQEVFFKQIIKASTPHENVCVVEVRWRHISQGASSPCQLFVGITTLAREVESFMHGFVSVAALCFLSFFRTGGSKRPEGGDMDSSWKCSVRKKVS